MAKRLFWTATALLTASMTLGTAGIGASDAHAKGKAKATAASKSAAAKGTAKATGKKETPMKVVAISPENKKALSDLMGEFKFGSTKAEVIAALTKQLDANYNEKIQATTDVMVQDRLRREKKAELRRTTETFIEFNGKRSGWDVSIVEDEIGHNTGESMLVHWENQNGKNQRRFFFFADGKLYKMFVSLDTSIIPADKRNFATFEAAMTSRYGAGEVEVGVITWNAGEFVVRAVDKLKNYDALGLVISEPIASKALADLRASKAKPKEGPSALTRAVLDTNDEKVDINANSGAANAVINGNK